MRIRFNDLPLSARERLAGMKRGGDSALVFAHREDETVVLVLFGIVFVVAAIGLVAALVGTADWSTHIPRELYWGMVPAIFFVVLIGLGALAMLLWRAPPYATGRYLFAAHIVETQGDSLDVHPIAEVTGVVLEHHTRRGRAHTSHYLSFVIGQGIRCRFSVSGNDEAAAVRQRWDQARATLASAWSSGDRATLVALDPFHECVTTGRWSTGAMPTSGPRCTSRPRWWGPLRLLTALLLSLSVPFAMFQLKFREQYPTKGRTLAPAPASTVPVVVARYRPKAGSEAAFGFVKAALEENERAHRTPVCVSVYGSDQATWAAIDAEIARLPAARGKSVDKFASSWSFFNSGFGTVEAVGKVFDEALGPGVLPAKTAGLEDTRKNCPYILVRPQPSAGKELYWIRDRFYTGLFGARFVVTTQLPGQGEVAAFELSVPAPTKAELDRFTGSPGGEVHSNNARYLFDKLKARLRQHFVR